MPPAAPSGPAAADFIRAEVAGDKLLAVPATVDTGRQREGCNADWQYRLLRSQFSFDDVQGSLETFEQRCDWKHLVDTPREGAQWSIPESLGNCRIIVSGENGTSFELLEHPAST